MPPIEQPVSSKVPCPCGSGKKYKRCCGPRDAEALRAEGKRSVWKIVVPVVAAVCLVFAALGGLLYREKNRPPVAPPDLPRSSLSIPPGTTPAPWTFDPDTNRHWDPSHNHWHDGPPPQSQSQSQSTTPSTIGLSPNAPAAPVPTATPSTEPAPAPYTYNAETNQHWDPTHNHWHDGPPPDGAG